MATDGTMTAGTTSTRRPVAPEPLGVPRRLRFAGREVPWWAAVLVLYAVSRLLTTALMAPAIPAGCRVNVIPPK